VSGTSGISPRGCQEKKTKEKQAFCKNFERGGEGQREVRKHKFTAPRDETGRMANRPCKKKKKKTSSKETAASRCGKGGYGRLVPWEKKKRLGPKKKMRGKGGGDNTKNERRAWQRKRVFWRGGPKKREASGGGNKSCPICFTAQRRSTAFLAQPLARCRQKKKNGMSAGMSGGISSNLAQRTGVKGNPRPGCKRVPKICQGRREVQGARHQQQKSRKSRTRESSPASAQGEHDKNAKKKGVHPKKRVSGFQGEYQNRDKRFQTERAKKKARHKERGILTARGGQAKKAEGGPEKRSPSAKEKVETKLNGPPPGLDEKKKKRGHFVEERVTNLKGRI